MRLARLPLLWALVAMLGLGCGDGGSPSSDGVCGDGVCDLDEDTASCPDDCPFVGCGDGLCEGAEDLDTCAEDCSAAGQLGGHVWAPCAVTHENPLVACSVGTTGARLVVDAEEALTYDDATGACTRWVVAPHETQLTIATCTTDGSADEITVYQDRRYLPSFTEGWLSLIGQSLTPHYGEVPTETAESVAAQCTSITEANCPPFNPHDPVDPALTGEWQHCANGGADPTLACMGSLLVTTFDGTEVSVESDWTGPTFHLCFIQYVAARLSPPSYLAYGECTAHGRTYRITHDVAHTVGAETYLTWQVGDGSYRHMMAVPDGTSLGCGPGGIVMDRTCP